MSKRQHSIWHMDCIFITCRGGCVLYCRWIMYVQPVTRVLTKKTLLFSDARSKVHMAAYALTYEKVRHGWWKNPFKKTPWTFHPYYFHISLQHCSIFLLTTILSSIVSPYTICLFVLNEIFSYSIVYLRAMNWFERSWTMIKY